MTKEIANYRSRVAGDGRESLRAIMAQHGGWLGAGIIVLALLLLILLINPMREFPVEDDWDYSKTVLNVLQTGTFHRLEVTQATVFFPALWGTLFVKLFGYSFATLRLSTLVLALGALLFFYALLGELGFDVPRRVVATLSLLVAPAFVYLAFSFMTDIPLFFGLLGALYFYVRAWRTQDLRLAVVGSAFAALGFLARQVGALIPLAFALFVLMETRGPDRIPRGMVLRWILAGTLLPLVAVATYAAWSRFGGGANWADGARTFNGTLGFWLQFDTLGVFVRRYAIAAATISIYVLGVWLAAWRALGTARRGWQVSARWQQVAIVVITLLFGIALFRAASRGEWFPYLTDILTRAGFRPYLAFFAESWGAHRPLILTAESSTLLTPVAAALGIALSALIVGRLPVRLTPNLRLVYLTTLVLAVASLTFFTYFERYLLPLMPGAIVLLLDATRRVRFSILGGTVGVLLVALFSIAFMQDYFAWNQVRWDVGRALLAKGTPVEKLDGGYEWNGWYLYDASIAHIRIHHLEMAIDPWKYLLDPEYMLAFQPPAGYRVMQEYPFATQLRAGGVDRILLLQRSVP
jgi:Dolichyl-phosphate-mannose-protein mannosyltransferase